MRTLAFIAFPLLLACALYVGAIAPALQAVDAMGASVSTRQPIASASAICYSDSAARHFGIAPRANAAACAAQGR